MKAPKKSDIAYLAIRRAIIEQALTPGTKLPEDRLGAEFQVSRTLIRAALAQLASEGLVVVGNKRVATVAQPSLDEARAVFEVRRCLENEVVRLVIERWQPAMGAALEGHVREEALAAKAGQVTASIRLAGEFHIKLAQMTGNALLERYLSEVATRCSLILAVYGRPHSSDCAINEHRELIDALRKKDAARAVKLMSDHIGGIESRALISEIVQSDQDLSAILTRYAAAVEPAKAAATLKPVVAKRRATSSK